MQTTTNTTAAAAANSDERPVRRRPGKLDTARKIRICDVVAMGGTLQTAAKIVGCSRRAIHYAADRDPEFAQRLKACRTEPCFSSVKTMNEVIKSTKSWRAAYYMLRDSRAADARRADLVPIRQVGKMLNKLRAAVDAASIGEKAREQIEQRFDNVLARFGEETADPFDDDYFETDSDDAELLDSDDPDDEQ
jgi:hypothetical protein